MLKPFPNGARICFIGDSLTAQNTVQWMTIDCYKRNLPNTQIEVFNCGVAGGTAFAALAYLEDDVFIHNPTHAVIGFGINDCARWELTRPRSETRYNTLVTAFERYKKSMRELCDILISRGIEVTLCTPPPYDEYHEGTEPAFSGCFALMVAYAEEVRKIAKEKNLPLCDYFSYFAREMQTDILYSGDHVHPNAHGYYTMAKHFLSEQGLELGEERNTPPEYLKEWCEWVAKRVEIFSGELMIVRDYSLPNDEKIKTAEEYARTRTDVIPRLIEIANHYALYKPQQAEIYEGMNKAYAKGVLNK